MIRLGSSMQTGISRAGLKQAFWLLLICLHLSNPVAAQPEEVQSLTVIGEVALSKGVVTARSDRRPLAALAKGSPIYLGDIIETASRSFVVVTFTDGGKVTLRPESRLDLNEYDATEGQEKESFELLKGGLRAVTGAIGKARPEQVKYTARNTTIGIRGTILVIKLCKSDTASCKLAEGLNTQAETDELEAGNKLVDIFIVDKAGGTRQRITRQQLRELLQGVYVSVIDGAIRVSTDTWYVDMEAGDKCLIDYSDGGLIERETNDGIECFIRGQGVEDVDVYLGDDAEKITAFNLFDDSEVFVGNEICEIN